MHLKIKNVTSIIMILLFLSSEAKVVNNIIIKINTLGKLFVDRQDLIQGLPAVVGSWWIVDDS